MTEERVQKILARAGLASRRRAEEIIRQGRVTVNGRVATLGDKADPDRDAVKVDGKRVRPRHQRRYLLLNKPKGHITARSDPRGRPTVFDLLPPGLRKGMVAVGRLDYHTEGLLLLTDDGDFAQRIAHPRHGCRKTYEVKVRGVPEPEKVERLRQGMVIGGRRTAPAAVRRRRTTRGAAGNSWWTVEISEGRTRQVREMFFRIGHPVQKLRRVAIGPLSDPRLPCGGFRELDPGEVEMLRRSAGGPGEEGGTGPGRRRHRGR